MAASSTIVWLALVFFFSFNSDNPNSAAGYGGAAFVMALSLSADFLDFRAGRNISDSVLLGTRLASTVGELLWAEK